MSSVLYIYSFWVVFNHIYTCRCTDSAIWSLYGWCHVKLLPSRRAFCVHHTTMHQFTVPIHANLTPALLAEWQGYFTCFCGNTRVERPNWSKSQHGKLTMWLKPETFRLRVWSSTTEPSPLPQSGEVSSFQAVVLGTEVFNRVLSRCPLVTYTGHGAATVLLKRVFTKLQPSYSNAFLHSSNSRTQASFITRQESS